MDCLFIGALLLPLVWEVIINPTPHTRSLLGLQPPRWSIQRLWRATETLWRGRRAWPRKEVR